MLKQNDFLLLDELYKVLKEWGYRQEEKRWNDYKLKYPLGTSDKKLIKYRKKFNKKNKKDSKQYATRCFHSWKLKLSSGQIRRFELNNVINHIRHLN